jgi:hypothetical protein
VSREVRFGRIGGGFMECGRAGGWWFGLRTSARPAKIAYAPPSDASVGYGILFTQAASHPAWRHLSPPDLGRRCQGEGRPDGCHGARCGRNGNSAQVATPVTLWHKFWKWREKFSLPKSQRNLVYLSQKAVVGQNSKSDRAAVGHDVGVTL